MRTLFLPLLLLAATATGCAAEVVASDDLPIADPEPVAEPEPTTAPEPVATLPDGEHVGYLLAATTNPATVTIDQVTWVADDGEPNGYRIDDPGLDPVDVAVADDAVLEVLRATGDPSTAETVDLEGLVSWLVDVGQPDVEALFDVVVTDGEVTTLQFRYRP